ncbi:Homeodomain-like protein, partial [Phlyctochytrium arcticum]
EKKKKRRVLTVDQQNILEDLFTRIPNPDSHLRTVLAAQLDLPAKNIQIWFQNRRAKLK